MAGLAIFKKKENDFLSGSPWKIILVAAVPLLIGNLVAQGSSIFDSFAMGLTDTNGFTAVNLCSNIVYFGTVYSSSFPSGISALTGRFYGEGKSEKVRRSLATSLVLSLISSIFISVLMLSLVDWLLVFSNVSAGAVFSEARPYLFLMFSLTLFALHYQGLISSFFTSIGRTEYSFVVAGCMALSFIVNDCIFTLGLRMGALGGGLSYGLAIIFSAIVGYVILYFRFPEYRLKKEDFKIDIPFAVEHLRLALPSAVQASVVGVGLFLLQRSLNAMGETAINAYSIANKVYGYLGSILGAVSTAAMAFFSQNFGAKNLQRFKKGFLQVSLVGFIVAVVASILTLALSSSLTSFFIHDQEGINAISPLVINTLYFYIACYFLSFYLGLFRNALYALGKPMWSFVSTIIETLFRGGFALFVTAKYGYYMIPLSETLAIVGSTSLCFIAFLVQFNKANKNLALCQNPFPSRRSY